MNDVDRRRDQWHIKKEVTWGHIVSTIMLAVGLVGVYIDINARIDNNGNKIAENANDIEFVRQIHDKDILADDKRMRRLEERNSDALKKIDATFDKIDKKLDKLIEKQHDH